MNEAEYLETRLDDQLNWYDRKSQLNQKRYKMLRAAEIVAAALVVLLAGYVDSAAWVKFAVGGLGLIVAVFTGLVGLYRFQEHWIEYRTTCEGLKREKFLYQTRTEPYDVAEPFALLVRRVEGLLSSENSKWVNYIQGTKEESGAKK